MLKIAGLHCHAGHNPVIRDITLDLEPGLLHVIVGPNGSGKSTFLKGIAGEWPLAAGEVFYDDQPLTRIDKTFLARKRAVMSQLPELHFPVRVDDIVMMGRYPHFSFRPRQADVDVRQEAMQLLSILPLAGRDYLTLSGGEKQRVQFARALAQIWQLPATGCRYLFLDEPVSSLDIHYQHQFMTLARSFLDARTVLVAVLHDLNLSLQYADRIIFLKEGRVAGAGPAPDIVTPQLVAEVFGITPRILPNPYGQRPVLVFE